MIKVKMFLFYGSVLTIISVCAAQRYPITASWFNQRFSPNEWNGALDNFTRNGGDTVLLGASPFVLRSEADITADPDFAGCGTTSGANTGPSCFQDAVTDLAKFGLNVASFASYKSEEHFSDSIIVCAQYEKKLVNTKTYFRLVIPTMNSSTCNLPAGSSVVVLFTVFSGVDSNELLVRGEADRNMSVYFALASSPVDTNRLPQNQAMVVFYEWTARILMEHRNRYSGMAVNNKKSKYKTMYEVIAGYSSAEQLPLGEMNFVKDYYLNHYKTQRDMVQFFGKKFLISSSVDLRKDGGYTVQYHKLGFETLANSSVADVINIHEGRGYGRGCYYWPTQDKLPVAQIDKKLDAVLHFQNKTLKANITFDDFYLGSNQEVFQALFDSRQVLQKAGSTFDLWLNIEAFELVQDDPCLSAFGTGNQFATDRATKGRLDMALSAASVFVQKVSVSSWDPEFTCTTKDSNRTLAQQVYSDAGRPIIAHCSFHSAFNRSVVVIGFNLLGETQGYTVTWTDVTHKRHISDDVHGYYFEAAYGWEHHLVGPLIYTQLYDPYYGVDVAPKGTVRVKAGDTYRTCVYTYDYTVMEEQ